MRTGKAVDTGIPRDQRIKNAHALLDKAVQHYDSKEDAQQNLSADFAVQVGGGEPRAGSSMSRRWSRGRYSSIRPSQHQLLLILTQ